MALRTDLVGVSLIFGILSALFSNGFIGEEEDTTLGILIMLIGMPLFFWLT